MIWSVLSWLSQHPAQVVGLLIFLLAGTWIISAAVYAIWLASEQRKQDEQRKRLRSLQAAIELTELLDIEAGRKPPAAAGLNRKRVS